MFYRCDNTNMDETTIFGLTKMPVIRKRSSPPGKIVNSAQLRIQRAINAAKHRPKPKPINELKMSKGPAHEYYIEWWNLGEYESAINVGMVSTRDIKNLTKLMIADGKRSIIYIKRQKDEKVLWNRRTR